MSNGIYRALLEANRDNTYTMKAKLRDGTIKSLIVKETKTTNPNDKQGSDGVRLKFYDGSIKVAELCISGIGTNMPFLYDFEVKESLRSHGYGGAILDFCVQKYKLNDLAVNVNNKDAIRFYERHNFKKRFNYKDGKDSLVYMQIHKRGYENR